MIVRKLGITGTRYVLPREQAESLETVIRLEWAKNAYELHHGCCTGTDALAHRIAFDLGMHIHIHPPLNERYKATSLRDGPLVWVHAARDYRERNDDIATLSDMLIACPNHPENDPRSKRSGTWQTVRLARWHNVQPIIIIEPDGNIRGDQT